MAFFGLDELAIKTLKEGVIQAPVHLSINLITAACLLFFINSNFVWAADFEKSMRAVNENMDKGFGNLRLLMKLDQSEELIAEIRAKIEQKQDDIMSMELVQSELDPTSDADATGIVTNNINALKSEIADLQRDLVEEQARLRGMRQAQVDQFMGATP
ncbi:MAG: hypothetical protein V4563_17540 [Pseudomonadota bacterium]